VGRPGNKACLEMHWSKQSTHPKKMRYVVEDEGVENIIVIQP